VEALVMRPVRQRVAELLGSMVGGALVALTMCLVMVLLTSFDSAVPKPEVFAWMALMSIGGIWAVMIPSKFWEGSEGDPLTRRFVLMVFGLALGVAAAFLASYLEVTLPYDPRFGEIHDLRLPADFYGEGQPRLMAYLACFGTLFVLVRWWRQADPLRRTRMSLWTVMVSVLGAGIVAGIWHFPQPWLMMIAATMSVSLQLASPWLHFRLRRPASQRR
jgi:drug/metabolite transporter (DMT)-like permease